MPSLLLIAIPLFSFLIQDSVITSPVAHAYTTSANNLVVTPHTDEIPKYLRWNMGTPEASISSFELQTAVTTFQRGKQAVQVHAQIHLADSEYFDYYNAASFNANKTAVFYELLLDECLLKSDDDDMAHGNDDSLNTDSRRKVKSLKASRSSLFSSSASVIQASPSDHVIALQYGWSCQADTIDYSQPRWYHADFTRQYFFQVLKDQQSKNAAHPDSLSNDDDDDASLSRRQPPLWWLASSNANGKKKLPLPEAALEAATALLVGPPTVVQQQHQSGIVSAVSSSSSNATMMIRRRLFTNLFLPGDSFATWLRYLLWIAVPSPEVSILLLDWSSVWFLPNASSSTPRGHRPINTARFSQMAWPLMRALMAGRLDQLKQLVFGQVVLAGHVAAAASVAEDDNSLLIAQRNDHALCLLQDELERKEQQQIGTVIALLYGCNHCPDLHSKLVDIGFQAVQTEWRTAWSVKLPIPDGVNNDSIGTQNMTNLVGFGFMVGSFLAVSGADWVSTLQDIAQAAKRADTASVVGLVFFYLVRHALLYVGLSKVILERG